QVQAFFAHHSRRARGQSPLLTLAPIRFSRCCSAANPTTAARTPSRRESELSASLPLDYLYPAATSTSIPSGFRWRLISTICRRRLRRLRSQTARRVSRFASGVDRRRRVLVAP